MRFLQWLNKKPKFTEPCIVIAANRFRGGWEYSAYLIERVEFDGQWYWGWLTLDGEEYGDLSEFTAQKFFIIQAKKPYNKN